MLRIQKIVGIERRFSLAAFKYAGHNKFERVGLEDGELFADKKSVLVHAVAIQEHNGRRKHVQIFLNVFDETGKRSNNYDTRLELPLTLRGMAAV